MVELQEKQRDQFISSTIKKNKQISFKSILLIESFNVKIDFTLKKKIGSTCRIYV